VSDRHQPTADDAAVAANDVVPSGRGSMIRIAIRVIVVVAALVIAGFVLAGIFEDLDLDQIRAAVARLSDAEWIALAMGWAIWIGAQGLQTGSLVTDLPARRGVLAFLGPTAVASVIPGPSDLPVRYSMYQSWGTSPEDAATAVAASGLFSVGSQLVLPAFAGVVIFVSGIQIDGFLMVIVAATLVLAAFIIIAAVALGSESRTRWVGDRLDPMWQRGRRISRRGPSEEGLGEQLAKVRARSFDYLSDKWLGTTGATVLATAVKCALLIMALRFVGIPEDALGWSAIFAVYALVAGLTVVPITPGSAGVAELALVGMLAPIAGREYVNEVAAGVVLYRLMTWILVIPAGLLALGIWRQSTRNADPDLGG
jgi:uncharacterized membrane protein YbhN (UPF0104 family)